MQLVPSGAVISDRYVLDELVGVGSSSQVFRARDVRDSGPVAVKLIPRMRTARAWARFEREVAALAQLDHPGIVRLLDHGRHAGIPFLVMELLDGEELEHVMARGEVEHDEILGIADTLLTALDALHTAGMVHRDVKPSNVMLTSRGPVLIDFGLVRPASRLSEMGRVVGTLPYMALEQLLGEGIDGRTDLYAVGVLVWEALTGAAPYAIDWDAPFGELLDQLLTAPAPDLAQQLPTEEIDERLSAWTLSALERDPADRFASAREMRGALRALRHLRASGVFDSDLVSLARDQSS